MSTMINEWVRMQYRNKYCNKKGELACNVNLDTFRKELHQQRPQNITEIEEATKRLHFDICTEICRPFPLNIEGKFVDQLAVRARIQSLRPDLDNKKAKKAQRLIQKANMAAAMNQKPVASNTQHIPLDNSLCAWISAQYSSHAFVGVGFIGWNKFANSLFQAKPGQSVAIRAALDRMRKPGHAWSLESPEKVSQKNSLLRKQAQAQVQAQGGIELVKLPSKPATPLWQATTPAIATLKHLAREEVELSSRNHSVYQREQHNTITTDPGSDSESESDDGQLSYNSSEPDFSLMDHLLADRGRTTNLEGSPSIHERDIAHAPLLAEELITMHGTALVPQYGLLGSCTDDMVQNANAKVFLNTNVPFSAFICGVQGSGKSHTTACMLENALIPSPSLGNLISPVSALVFSYGEFSNGGSGFSISEAAFLATASQRFPGQRVKKITVLTSPSNPAIKKFYNRFPNIKIKPFKLKAKTLDIGTLLTLMAVNEKSEVPLYMAKVESILRGIATESEDGVFDYDLFKQRLALENFDPKQTTMLEMRLGLLESFLDTEGNVPEPTFRPGEITIIDLSDPFVTPNTACILFKVGLERFMQSSAPGKMVVLDEAHKYMLNSPGSKVLNDYLKTLIRLQHHRGARVVISTQEPTVSTDLIALCSVTVIHRFTSPDWFGALRRHINAVDNDGAIMQQIEGLTTGEALVYSPNAVLGKNEDGSLRKAVGRLLRVDIRNRLTADGGESVMAV